MEFLSTATDLSPAHAFAVYTARACLFKSQGYRESEAFADIAESGARLTVLPDGRILRLRFSLAGEEHIMLICLAPAEEGSTEEDAERDSLALTDTLRLILSLTDAHRTCREHIPKKFLFSSLLSLLQSEISDRIRGEVPPLSEGESFNLDFRGLFGTLGLLLLCAAQSGEKEIRLGIEKAGARHTLAVLLPQEARSRFLEKLTAAVAQNCGFEFLRDERGFSFVLTANEERALALRIPPETQISVFLRALRAVFSL